MLGKQSTGHVVTDDGPWGRLVRCHAGVGNELRLQEAIQPQCKQREDKTVKRKVNGQRDADLDDALVYCDDDRIQRMFDALSRAGKNQQIIVLTCRLRSFGALGGHTLRVNSTGLSGAGRGGDFDHSDL